MIFGFLRRLIFLVLAGAGVMLPAVALVSCSGDNADRAPDLTTPVKAAESFFKAAKAADVAALKKIISPRIQEDMAKAGKTMEDFAKIWDAQAEFISAAEPAAKELAKTVRVAVPVIRKNRKSGKEEAHTVRFSKIGDQWLLDER